jgi:hypothetical protein
MSGKSVLALAFLVVVVVALAAPASAAPSGHYIPQAGDQIRYLETVTLTNGHGSNYSGYAEDSVYTGTMNITAVSPGGTESAAYAASGTYRNNSGGSYPWAEHGTFTFSAVTFLYVAGTDNQTGYTNPTVWFYMNNSLPLHATFRLLDTVMSVASTGWTFADPYGSTGYVRTIYAIGDGSYHRSDAYGNFTATYTWQAYFDPATGYLVGYVYTENDSAPDGNGFTFTDTLTDTGTSFALASVAAPAAPFPWALVLGGLIVAVIVIVVVVVAALALRRRRRGGLGRSALPRHAAGSTAPPPLYPSPPPIRLVPGDQPSVQQIVLKETVKVPCRFCGTLIDSTLTVCPKCGAPRT